MFDMFPCPNTTESNDQPVMKPETEPFIRLRNNGLETISEGFDIHSVHLMPLVANSRPS